MRIPAEFGQSGRIDCHCSNTGKASPVSRGQPKITTKRAAASGHGFARFAGIGSQASVSHAGSPAPTEPSPTIISARPAGLRAQSLKPSSFAIKLSDRDVGGANPERNMLRQTDWSGFLATLGLLLLADPGAAAFGVLYVEDAGLADKVGEFSGAEGARIEI